MSSPGPVRVAVVNDYEIVVAGIAALVAPFADRVAAVELEHGVPLTGDAEVDVVLYDTFSQVPGVGIELEDLVRADGPRVVVFSWNADAEAVDRALARGAAGFLSKRLRAEQIVEGLERVRAGERVVPTGAPGSAVPAGAWPGRDLGLTAREAEVVALITQGLSNHEIAEALYVSINSVKTYIRTELMLTQSASAIYVSINSVKTYIRTAYRKMGVRSRSQAVGWGVQHGFAHRRPLTPVR